MIRDHPQESLFSSSHNDEFAKNPPIDGAAESETIFRVSQLLDFVNDRIGEDHLYVQGEITGFQPHPSGVYFSLKDAEDGSLLNCYMRPWAYRALGFSLDDGMEIKIGGFLEIYKARGRLSFQVDSVMLAGEGSRHA